MNVKYWNASKSHVLSGSKMSNLLQGMSEKNHFLENEILNLLEKAHNDINVIIISVHNL